MTELAITVHGMTCDGCERSIVRAVSIVPGVESVRADHAGALVTVTPASVDRTAVVAAIEDAGFEVAAPA